MNEEGWICEPADARHESWMSDAPWFKANERSCHISTVRTCEGVQRITDAMAFVKRGQILHQLFYGTPFLDVPQMTGFAVRYSTRDPSQAQNAVNVIDGRGRGSDLTSAWLICWGHFSVFMVTPDGLPPPGASEIACVVRDWRYIVRIANIAPDVSGEDLRCLFDQAVVKLPYAGPENDRFRSKFYVRPELERKLPTNLHRGIFVRPMPALSVEEPRVD